MPDADLPHAAQAGVGGDVKYVESVACEGCGDGRAVEVPVSAAALAPVQADSYVSRGAWRETEAHYLDSSTGSDLSTASQALAVGRGYDYKCQV